MCLHRAPCHVEFLGDFGVVAALQQKFSDFFFAWPQTNFFHAHFSPIVDFC
jgi:hypothetical protein